MARELDLSQLNRLLGEQDSIKGFFETEIELLGTAENPFINKTFLIGDLNIEFPQLFTNTLINNTTPTHKDTNKILDHIIK